MSNTNPRIAPVFVKAACPPNYEEVLMADEDTWYFAIRCGDKFISDCGKEIHPVCWMYKPTILKETPNG